MAVSHKGVLVLSCGAVGPYRLCRVLQRAHVPKEFITGVVVVGIPHYCPQKALPVLGQE